MSPQSGHHNGSFPFALNSPTNQQSLFDVLTPLLRDTAAVNTVISYYRLISATVFSSPIDNHEMQKIKHETKADLWQCISHTVCFRALGAMTH